VKKRFLWYSLTSVLAGVLYIGSCTVTVPAIGCYGPPLGMMFGLAIAIIIWVTVAPRREDESFPFEWRRLGGLTAALAAAITLQIVGDAVWPGAHAAVIGLVVITFVGIRRGARRRASGPSASVAPAGRRRVALRHLRPRPGGAASGPTEDERRMLAALVRDGVPPAVSRPGRVGTRPSCCTISSPGCVGSPALPAADPEHDGAIASYLPLRRARVAARDTAARELIDAGVGRPRSAQASTRRSAACAPRPGRPGARRDAGGADAGAAGDPLASRWHPGPRADAHALAAVAVLRARRTPDAAGEMAACRVTSSPRGVRNPARTGSLGRGPRRSRRGPDDPRPAAAAPVDPGIACGRARPRRDPRRVRS